MSTKTIEIESTAQAYLHLLQERGIEYFFGNAGTDFASIIDAFARASALGLPAPTPVTVPHEVPAVAMAYGYYMITGRPQVVMVHVNVGTANALSGIINAARDHVPVLFTAGRTPITEFDVPGARDLHIHWAQESFDQGAMVREYVKWDYELRRFDQLEDVVDRALELAMSEPRGPVYLTLPREVLAEAHSHFSYRSPSPRSARSVAQASDGALTEAAALFEGASRPLLIAGMSGRDKAAVPALVALAERLGSPVVEFNRRAMCFPTDHPLHLGFDATPFIANADCIGVVESDVPWFPGTVTPSPNAKVIHIGADPLFAHYPMRSYPSDVALPGRASDTLNRLAEKVSGRAPAERRAELHALHNQQRAQWAHESEQCANDEPVDPRWLSRCIDTVRDEKTILVNEYDLLPHQVTLTEPGTFFGSSSASGLGWALGASLGAKLARPEHTIVTTVGDGAYMFGNPTPCHFVAAAQGLATLTVVFNNRTWGAVQMSNRTLYPDGWASRTNQFPLSQLDPSPAFEMLAQANGGFGERVDRGEDVLPALERALHAVRVEKRQALLNVICKRP